MENKYPVHSLKETRFYQEAKEEGRQEGLLEANLEAVKLLLQFGLTAEQIAQALKLKAELVIKVAQQTKNQNNELTGD
ncbi:MAG: hypothetical protein KME23_13020 [Goleter apudmare HA4340-LM2]|jgi:predicted transposase/invertase (TIGR01784 family)|nr:hypothetical protein [Goleter apudmare HA4340-LM2]